MLHLIGDPRYREERKRQMARHSPASAMQGVNQGMNSALVSTVSGVEDVYKKPKEGFASEGMAGFAIGACQGIAGLLVKPMTGALDLVTKATEGMSSEGEEGLKVRKRPPRVFYGKEQVIRNYNL